MKAAATACAPRATTAKPARRSTPAKPALALVVTQLAAICHRRQATAPVVETASRAPVTNLTPQERQFRSTLASHRRAARSPGAPILTRLLVMAWTVVDARALSREWSATAPAATARLGTSSRRGAA